MRNRSASESVRLDDREAVHGIFALVPGERLRMSFVLSTGCGAIDGQVMAHGKPNAFSDVLLLESGTPESPGDIGRRRRRRTWNFSINRVPPGRYLLRAWSQLDPAVPGATNLADIAARTSVVVVGVRGGRRLCDRNKGISG